MGGKSQFKSLLYKIPFAGKVLEEYFLYKKNASFPPGHFYSPIVDVDQVRNNRHKIWAGAKQDCLPGIDLNKDGQLELLKEFAKYYPELPFSDSKTDALRYYFNNEYYSYADGIVLYSVLRHFRPARIIEVGSGYSSALMLDVMQKFLPENSDLTFIEPYPERLNSLLRNNDREKVSVKEVEIQTVPPEFFSKLEAKDIFFVDSSHVSKTGSDLNYILFNILPALKPGVVIHFHDIFYPFEYPEAWVLDGRNWNEAYILRAFLMGNPDYKIIFFTSYMHQFHNKEMIAHLPLSVKNNGAGIWLQKVR